MYLIKYNSNIQMHKYTLQFGIYINIINPLNIAYNREVKVKV